MAEVKLKDIAQAAGVSTVTVSNALSGKRGVSNDVREKIEDRKSTRLNSSHSRASRMPSSA